MSSIVVRFDEIGVGDVAAAVAARRAVAAAEKRVLLEAARSTVR
jgi:hypothetical protein